MASSRQLLVEIIGDDRSLQRTYKRASASTAQFEKETSRVTRGVAAGSGAFKGLGRNLAFASAGFLGAASAADLIRGAISQASEGAAIQKQLAAQFRASGKNLGEYQTQIDATTNRLSLLAGFEDNELKAAFTTAFRGSNSVAVALKIQATAADVARGRHISLEQATIALTKAYGGQVTALRRLGIQVPTNLHGLAALTFVQEKFAGQARAGTTAQQRFSAEFKNFEEIAGTALLPTFNKLLNQAAKWLANSENQKRVQKDVSTGAKILGGSLNAVGKTFGFLTSKTGQIVTGFALTKQALHGVKTILHEVNTELSSYRGNILKIGAGDREMRGAQAMLRENAATRAPVATGPAPHPRASLNYQLSLLQQQLAKAELTASQKDDRATLVRLGALTREKIAKTKDLAKRTQLYQQLGSYEQQIASIDAKAAADKKARQDKELQKKKDAAAADQKFYAKLKAQGDALLAQFKKNTQAQKAALAAATADAFQAVGDLFAAPVESATKGILGVTGGGSSIKGLTAGLKAQNDAAARENKDLARIAKRGGPASLIASLRALGPGGAANVHAIATASGKDFKGFLRQYERRQKVVQQIANAEIHARTVVVHAQNARSSATTPASQRRGRAAGVPSSIGSFINP